MFNREQKDYSEKDAETIIGPSVRVKGNFHGQGNIIIEGLVEGSIKTDKHLLIGEKAVITAGIEAGEAKIGGVINGNIVIKGYLEITASAKINGDIEATVISIEKGALINGKIIMQGGEKKRPSEEK